MPILTHSCAPDFLAASEYLFLALLSRNQIMSHAPPPPNPPPPNDAHLTEETIALGTDPSPASAKT